MQTTIDAAGRVVIPKALRDALGIRPGAVDITIDGVALRIEVVGGSGLVERDGLLVIPATGESIDDDVVRELRDAGRR
jgi:AbrB family looped-hinge helix DNA binding protein